MKITRSAGLSLIMTTLLCSASQTERKHDAASAQKQAKQLPLGITRSKELPEPGTPDFRQAVRFQDLSALEIDALDVLGMPLYPRSKDASGGFVNPADDRVFTVWFITTKGRTWTFSSRSNFQQGEVTLIPRSTGVYSLGITALQTRTDTFQFVEPLKSGFYPGFNGVGKYNGEPILVTKNSSEPWAKTKIIGGEEHNKANEDLLKPGLLTIRAHNLIGKSLFMASVLSPKATNDILFRNLTQDAALGWTFEKNNSFTRGEIVMVQDPKDGISNSLVWGITLISYGPEDAPFYIVQVGANILTGPLSADKIGKRKGKAIMAHYKGDAPKAGEAKKTMPAAPGAPQ